jgi:hypothetical protein
MRRRIAIAALCGALLAAVAAPARARVAGAGPNSTADDAVGLARVVAAGQAASRLVGREPSPPVPSWGKLALHAPVPFVVWMRLASGEAASRTPAHAPVAPPSAPRSCRGPPAA